jgi:hypothetical protein
VDANDGATKIWGLSAMMALRLLLILVLFAIAACSSRPSQIAAFDARPDNLIDRTEKFDGIYVGEGQAAACETPKDGMRQYDPPIVAGVISKGSFIGNLDGCRVEMKVFKDGSVQGWTFIRKRRFIPITYTMFDGQFDGDRIVGDFDQAVQGNPVQCRRGPVIMEKQDIDKALADLNATVQDAIEYFSPSARCRTGGIQFP